MILVDTNIILRYILKDDLQQYNDVIKLLETHSNLYLANEVIAEVVYVLTKS